MTELSIEKTLGIFVLTVKVFPTNLNTYAKAAFVLINLTNHKSFPYTRICIRLVNDSAPRCEYALPCFRISE